MAAARSQDQPKRGNPSGPSSKRLSGSWKELASSIGEALDILRKVKHKVVGDEFDEESQRRSHEGRLDDHENRLAAVEANQSDRNKVIGRLERSRVEADVRITNLERGQKRFGDELKKVVEVTQQPAAEKVTMSLKFSKRALRLAILIVILMGSFLGAFVSALTGKVPGLP